MNRDDEDINEMILRDEEFAKKLQNELYQELEIEARESNNEMLNVETRTSTPSLIVHYPSGAVSPSENGFPLTNFDEQTSHLMDKLRKISAHDFHRNSTMVYEDQPSTSQFTFETDEEYARALQKEFDQEEQVNFPILKEKSNWNPIAEWRTDCSTTLASENSCELPCYSNHQFTSQLERQPVYSTANKDSPSVEMNDLSNPANEDTSISDDVLPKEK
ncbi:hypothetical protein M3Y94_01153300 [Aphelenchoides besseyi]|nr:hypothetical protein M3Y94_01153300 [Aphelenchoides besseyi]KAI6227987.1 hypothetical protein M3Y95_00574800 [Aphelenchoides besseyi]